MHQKLSLYSSWSFILPITSITCHWIYFIDENYAWFLASCHRKQTFNNFLTLTYILIHDIAATYTEKCTVVHLMSTSLRNESLTSSWWTIQKNSFPRFSRPSENLRKSHWHYNSFFESLLGFFKTSNVIPSYFWFLSYNDSIKIIFNFWFFSIKYLFSFIIFNVIAHHFQVFKKIVQSCFESFFITFILTLKQLNEFLIVWLSCLFASLHRLKIILFWCLVKF